MRCHSSGANSDSRRRLSQPEHRRPVFALPAAAPAAAPARPTACLQHQQRSGHILGLRENVRLQGPNRCLWHYHYTRHHHGCPTVRDRAPAEDYGHVPALCPARASQHGTSCQRSVHHFPARDLPSAVPHTAHTMVQAVPRPTSNCREWSCTPSCGRTANPRTWGNTSRPDAASGTPCLGPLALSPLPREGERCCFDAGVQTTLLDGRHAPQLSTHQLPMVGPLHGHPITLALSRVAKLERSAQGLSASLRHLIKSHNARCCLHLCSSPAPPRPQPRSPLPPSGRRHTRAAV